LLGNALAGGYERVLSGIRIERRESTGSVANVEALQRGEADIGFVFADVAYFAYVGALDETPAPFDRLRGIAVVQLSALHLVVRPGLAIRDVSDLRGRRVAIGLGRSGTSLTSRIVLGAYGVGPDQFVAASVPLNERARTLAEGTHDAAFVIAGYPAEAILPALEAGGFLLNVDGLPAERLRSEYPFLRPVFIPKGTYPAQKEPIHTIGVETLLVCRSDLPDQLVYDLTRGLFDAAARPSAATASLRRVNLERAPATTIPLHPGASRYYRERELRR
jgi:hypothetical protein